MTLEPNTLRELLNEIGEELGNQISLAKNGDTKIDAKKLSQQSKKLDDVIMTSKLSNENKLMLQKFSRTMQDSSTVKSLRYEKQDLERVLSNLNCI